MKPKKLDEPIYEEREGTTMVDAAHLPKRVDRTPLTALRRITPATHTPVPEDCTPHQVSSSLQVVLKRKRDNCQSENLANKKNTGGK